MTSTTTAIATLLALVMTQAAPARRSKVRLSVTIAEYDSTVYVRGPSGGADHVLLRGQPLTLRLSIVNHGEDQVVRLRPSESAAFRVHVAAVGSAEPVAQGVVSPSPRLSGGGRQGPHALPATMKQRESLQWDASVPGFQQLPAGRYRVKADAHVESTPGGAPEVNNDSLVIELRDIAGEAERVELLRITATRALSNNDLAQADGAARQLLAAYPQSAFAYMLIGDVAAARKDVSAARTAYVAASKLLGGRGDTLFAAVATEHQMSETIGAIDMKIAALGR